MKRILTTIIALVYISTSSGATVYFHYCMGKLVSWGLTDHDSKDCRSCGMSKKADNNNYSISKMGCCKDDHKQVKTNNDQKIVSSEFHFLKFSPAPFTAGWLSLSGFRIPSFAVEYPATNAPPLIDKLPVFLLNRNFRI